VNSSMESALPAFWHSLTASQRLLTGLSKSPSFTRDLFESWSYSLPCGQASGYDRTSGAMGTSWKPHAGFTSWRTAHVNPNSSRAAFGGDTGARVASA